MRHALLVAISVIVGGIVGWTAHSLLLAPVRPSDPFTFTDRLGEVQSPFLYASGTWRGLDPDNKANTVRIFCDGAEKSCDLSQADIVSVGGTPHLSVYKQSFKVTEMDAKSFTAVESVPSVCVSQKLLIDRQAKSVNLVRTKINREEQCARVRDEPLTLSLVDGTAR
jgi:hypothetical protein